MAKTIHSDIPKAIHAGAGDADLNDVIQAYLDDNNVDKTVDQWRVENYKQLRRWAYPRMEELNDAQAKRNSGVDELENEGQQQLDDYVSACLDVKTRFPKE